MLDTRTPQQVNQAQIDLLLKEVKPSTGSAFNTDQIIWNSRDLLGSGKYGQVYKGWDQLTKQHVAIKFFCHEIAQKHFRVETDCLGRVRHPGVVTLLRSGALAPEVTYAVLELLPHSLAPGAGPPIFRRTWQDVTGLLIGCAEALEYSHSLGIVNGDIKPANILLTADGKPKVADWGSAASCLATDPTLPSRVLASPAYGSLEALLGDRADPLMDIFALACSGFELIAAHRLHTAETEEELFVQRLAPITLPDNLPSEVPKQVWELLLSAMHPDLKQRPQSMNEFAAALRGVCKRSF